MAIHQIIVSASPGDAITNNAIELRGVLRQVGKSEIFAPDVHAELDGDVLKLEDYTKVADRRGRDLLVYHASIGEASVCSFLLARPERLVLVYHNISPSEPFRPYDPRFANLLDQGRFELRLLRDRTVMALGDSRFNATELEALGYQDVRHSPLVVDPWFLRNLEPDTNVSTGLTALEGPVILSVGQMLPHKRPHLLMQAFHVLSTYLLPEAHCIMVGAFRFPAYGGVVRRYAQELNLLTLHMTGPVRPEELAAYYRGADLFVTVSMHEGFCVPLLEAMAFDVPILASDQGAIAETLGDAGVRLSLEDLDSDGAPLLLAEAMAHMLEDRSLCEGFRERGRTRLQAFDPATARGMFVEHLLSVA